MEKKSIAISMSLPAKEVMERARARGVERTYFVRSAVRQAARYTKELGLPLDAWGERTNYNFSLHRGGRAFIDLIARTPKEKETLLHRSKAYREFISWYAGALMERERILARLREAMRNAPTNETKQALQDVIRAIEGEDAADK